MGQAQAGLDAATLLHGNRIFSEFKGALAEQYVQQQLRAESGIQPYYWVSEVTRTEIDFVFHQGMSVVPVEVKAELNLQAKSMKAYCHRFAPPVAVRTSMEKFYSRAVPFSAESPTRFIDIPLYALCRLAAECSAYL